MAKINQKFNFSPKIKLFIFFLLFLLFLPGVAHGIGAIGSLLASIGAFIITTATTILTVSVIVILILQLFLGVMGLINAGLATLVSWSIQPGAITWGYTRNPFVNAGLEITGGFVSMGLVLALVAIALATILRLEGWDTKRLLFRFIIAALLVYFAPVICGLIIGATNIFMWYFADRIGGLGVITTTFGNIAMNIISAFLGVPVLQQITTVAASIIQLIFQLYLALVLISFFLLFTFRYAAIWIAVILSPIAFVCWILPATKGYWDWWWKNFLQWALAGPITAFFLYMGARAAEEVARARWNLVGILSGFGGVATHLGQLIPYLFPIGLLNLGMILGVQGAGVGANLVVKWAEKGTGFIRGLPSQTLRTRVGKKAIEKVAAIAPAVAKNMERLAKKGQKVKGVGWALEAVPKGIAAGFQMVTPHLLRYAVRARQARIPPEFAAMTPDEQERYVSSLASIEDRIQFAAEMKKLGTLQKTSKEFREKIIKEAESLAKSPYFKKQIEAIFDALPDKMTKEVAIALEVSPEKPPEKAKEEVERRIKPIVEELKAEIEVNPELKNEIQEQMKKTGRTQEQTIEDIAVGSLQVAKMTPKEVTDLAKASFDSVTFRWGMRRSNPAKIGRIFEEFDQETAERVLAGPGGLNHLFESLEKQPEKQKELLIKLHKENESLLRWFCLNPAGRSIKFIGRDVLEKEYGNYGNFLKEIRGIPPVERVEKPEVTPPKIIVPPEKAPPKVIRRYGRPEVEEIREEERRRTFGRREIERKPEERPPGRGEEEF